MQLATALLLASPAYAGPLLATVTTPDGRPLADAAVVAEPVAGTRHQARHMVAIEQRNREFIPYLTVIQTGTRVEFPNRDPVKHHVYSFSPAKSFEIKLYSGKPTQPVLFDKPGEVAVGCNIHDWMEAYILVVDSPYFAKTGQDGKALLRQLPPGEYRLRVWHPRQNAETPRREIRITAAAARLDMVLDVAPRTPRTKPPVETGERY